MLEILTALLCVLKTHKAAALICLQTHHIWLLPAAKVSPTGLMPQNMAELPASQPVHMSSCCLKSLPGESMTLFTEEVCKVKTILIR